MQKGDLFVVEGRTFCFENFEYDNRGHAQAYIAQCLEPKPEETGDWWCFEIMSYRNLPSRVTTH